MLELSSSDGTEVKSYKVDVEWLDSEISVDGNNLMTGLKRGEVLEYLVLNSQNKRRRSK